MEGTIGLDMLHRFDSNITDSTGDTHRPASSRCKLDHDDPGAQDRKAIAEEASANPGANGAGF